MLQCRVECPQCETLCTGFQVECGDESSLNYGKIVVAIECHECGYSMTFLPEELAEGE